MTSLWSLNYKGIGIESQRPPVSAGRLKGLTGTRWPGKIRAFGGGGQANRGKLADHRLGIALGGETTLLARNQ